MEVLSHSPQRNEGGEVRQLWYDGEDVYRDVAVVVQDLRQAEGVDGRVHVGRRTVRRDHTRHLAQKHNGANEGRHCEPDAQMPEKRKV
jgi:hypothetical protein